MRRVTRQPLSQETEAFLIRERLRVGEKPADPTREWKRARKKSGMKGVHDALCAMAGARERCMYCSDSHGSDIEHFWPKAPYPGKMFDWPNLLLCCTPCGRFKGDQFPVDGATPLLLDPTSDDPWAHLDFDPATGNITARFKPSADSFSRKGEATVSVLHLDRREALAAGYLRTWRRLTRIVENQLAVPGPADSLTAKLHEADDHGLLDWCLHGAGQNVHPFPDLREKQPLVWKRLLR